MNKAPIHPHRTSTHARRKTLSAAASLAAAMLALNALPDLKAANGSWQANAADQGVGVTITVGSAAWAVSPQLAEGDAVYIGATAGVNLGTNYSYYYAVGVGATPSDYVRFSQSPGAGTFSPNGTNSPLAVTKVPSWNTAGNWAGGVIPNGVGDQATIATNANTPAILVDKDLTVGAINVDTTTSAANGLSLIATARNGGLVSTLALKASSGTPSVTLTGGNTFSFSESKISGTTPANASTKLIVVGDQGLSVDNQNPVVAPTAMNSGSMATPVSSVGTYGTGQVRFGFGLDWSRFSGDLTLARGTFQALAGGTMNNNLTSLPMNSKVVLGTGTNTARLELGGSNGQTVIRGLESTSPNSSVINIAQVANPAVTSIGLATLEVGSYGTASDHYTYAGNIGSNANVADVLDDLGAIVTRGVSSAPAIRLVKVGPGTQVLSGVNNLNATQANSVLVAVNGGKLSLGTTGAIGAITGGQGAANGDSSFLLKNGEFEISGLGVAAPRTQAFGGSLIFGSIAANTGSPDDKQAAQSNSASTLTVIADPAQPATLTFGSLKPRQFQTGSPTANLNGVTMLFRGTSLGSTPGAGVATIQFTTAPVTGGGSLFSVSGGALGGTQAPVLKGALADTSPTGSGTGFATYDPATGIRLLSGAEQLSVSTGAAYDAASTGDNIALALSADQAITGHQSNTLRISNDSGATRTVTNSGTELKPSNGLLFAGSSPIVLAGGQLTGTAQSDTQDVVIHSINTSSAGVTIQSAVSNVGQLGANAAGTYQGWITYAGPGNFRLEGTQNPGNTGGIVFNGTGSTTLAAPVVDVSNFAVNQGTVKLDTGASWTSLPRLLVAPGAKFDLNGIGGNSTVNRYSDVNAPINASGLTVNPIAGEVTNSAAGAPVDLILSGQLNGPSSQATTTAFFGQITGNLNLVVDKSASSFNATTQVTTYTYGSQAFSNVNTYTGATKIRSGNLNLLRGGLLPATTVVTLGTEGSSVNSTLALGDNNGSTNGAIRQEIAGLYAVGTGTAAVVNNSSNVSQLTLNIPAGVDNVYTGNLGVAAVANGTNSNLFVLRKTGAGTFEAAGAITGYTAGTIVQGGVLRVSADAKLGQVGPLAGPAGSADAPAAPISAFANSIILDGGTLQATTTANFILDAKRGVGLGPTSGSTGGNGTLSVDSGIKLTYAGVIASAGNTGANTLVKSGAGTLALDGASTFTGTTQVSAGALGGVGSLSSNVTVASGAALAPGNGGIGTFTINGALTLSGGSVLNLDLGAPGTSGTSDKLQLGGALSSGGTTTVNFTDAGGFGVGTYTLISGTAPINASNFAVGTIPSGFRGTFASAGNSLTVTIEVGSQLTALESWRQTHFGASANSGNAADSADPDNDGLANLLEYATNSNPNVANASPLSLARSGDFLTLTYTRIADTSLTYTVEGSNDLASWSTVATANNPSTGAQNTAGQVTVTDTVSLTARRFLRLKVSY